MTKEVLSIIGFGNQARAWAQNLTDNAWPVRVYTRTRSDSFERAQSLGLDVHLISEQMIETESAIALLIPDHTQSEFLQHNAHRFAAGTKILVAHGYTVAYEKLQAKYPQFDFILLAPKGIASELRKRKCANQNIGAVWSKQESSQHEAFVTALAKNLGITHLYASSFAEECKADLFSEQSLLCGVVPYAAQKSFQFLINKGIAPEVAFMECWMELQLITTALVEKGPAEFFQMISPNALLGSQVASDLIFDEKYDAMLEKLWLEIENGEFERKVNQSDFPALQTKIMTHWKSTELQKNFNQLKSIL